MKTINYTYTNVYTCRAIKSKTIMVLPNPSFICGNNFTDNCTPEFYKNPNSGISNPKSVYQWNEMIRHDLLDVDILGANENHFTRDAFVQFFGVVVPCEQGECGWGEVFAGSLNLIRV